jgi:hypothetical protein
MKKISTEKYNEIVRLVREDGDWLFPVMELILDYYHHNPTGGALHIVLDDGNLSDEHVAWCEGYAHGINDDMAVSIAGILRAMTLRQRSILYTVHSC